MSHWFWSQSSTGRIFMCHCLGQYSGYSKRKQQVWTSLTQGAAESGWNPLTENGWELEGGSKTARVSKKARLVLNWSAWRCSNELESRTNLQSLLVYLGFHSSLSVSQNMLFVPESLIAYGQVLSRSSVDVEGWSGERIESNLCGSAAFQEDM